MLKKEIVNTSEWGERILPPKRELERYRKHGIARVAYYGGSFFLDLSKLGGIRSPEGFRLTYEHGHGVVIIHSGKQTLSRKAFRLDPGKIEGIGLRFSSKIIEVMPIYRNQVCLGGRSDLLALLA